MIIVVVLIITVVVDSRRKCLKARLATCLRCLRGCVREAEVDALTAANVDYILGCVRKAPICAGVLDGQSIGTRQ
jgi:hypothetical protein